MRKAITLLLALIILTGSYASVNVVQPKLDASKILIPVGKTGKQISLLELSQISVEDLQVLTGKKMDFFDRMSFKAAQKRVRHSINADGTISNKKLERYLKQRSGETGFHLGGFALGFFLGAIGIVIAYVINDDYKKNRVKWAWIGFGTFIVLYVALVVAIIHNSN